MEYRVDVPLMGKAQLIRHWGYDFCDFEGSMTSRGKFYCFMGEWEILRFQPDLLTYFPACFRDASGIHSLIQGLGGQLSPLF